VEGFGMVVLEAMGLGIPYVCSDIPPLIEITENGKGGLIFKKDNPNDLADKLFQIIANKKMYLKKSEEALNFVRKYDWNVIVRQIEGLYKKDF
jgi:glycosyltransferase involved in cell wall biosynthesis